VTTFGLVHGAFHGGWCWQRLVAELAARGHRSVVMDLPCDDPEAGTSRYTYVVVDALGEVPGDDLVLVGHSLGGLILPLVAARRPVRRMIFLCAFVPRPGQAFGAWLSQEPDLFPPSPDDIWPVADPDGLLRWPAERAVRALYPDCPPDVAAWAAARLRRQSAAPHQEVCPLAGWPEVPASVVYGEDDLAIAADWLRRTAKDLGTSARGLPGGHSPFLARPSVLADLLVELSAPTA
jgi:pimeloyl-ACP methyl ester carboxylesterase